jgi:hypothetical protein
MIQSGDRSTIGLYRSWMMSCMNSVLDAMMMCNKQSVQKEVAVLTTSLDPVLLLMEDCEQNYILHLPQDQAVW